MDETTDAGQGKHLQPFSIAPGCIKCLNRFLDFKLFGIDEEEYLEVTCNKCGHSWNMKTADARKGKDLIVEAPEVVDKSLTNKLELVEAKTVEINLECKDNIPVVGSEIKVKDVPLEGIAAEGATDAEIQEEKNRLDELAKKKVEDDETKLAPVEEK